jgi:hypothetical protein
MFVFKWTAVIHLLSQESHITIQFRAKLLNAKTLKHRKSCFLSDFTGTSVIVIEHKYITQFLHIPWFCTIKRFLCISLMNSDALTRLTSI